MSVQKHGEKWMTYDCRVSTCFELSNLSAILKGHFKCLIFLCGLHEPCPNGVCCRIISVIGESDRITLEDRTNECMKLKKDTITVTRLSGNQLNKVM